MAKQEKSCTRKLIRIKTKRGRVITFMGRKGGQTKAGGKCANQARRVTAGQRAARRAIAGAGRACRNIGKPGDGGRNTNCIKQYIAHHLPGSGRYASR